MYTVATATERAAVRSRYNLLTDAHKSYDLTWTNVSRDSSVGIATSYGQDESRWHDADRLPTSSAVGHERVELYLYSPYGPPQCLYKGELYLYLLPFKQ